MNSAELVDAGKKYIETTAQMQQELIAKLNTMSLEWLARAQVEADLMSKLSAKLTAARTAPDVASAHSEWFAEWIKLCGENSRRFFPQQPGTHENRDACAVDRLAKGRHGQLKMRSRRTLGTRATNGVGRSPPGLHGRSLLANARCLSRPLR